ncbi:MAG: hypothetical protein K6E96_03725 [Bacteroidales bacterium]|nr:hypothetical protein [Bacteroidales bacterium]
MLIAGRGEPGAERIGVPIACRRQAPLRNPRQAQRSLGQQALPITTHLGEMPHYPLLTTHYPLPTTHYPLPTTHYSLPTTHYSLPTTHYSLPTYNNGSKRKPRRNLDGRSSRLAVGS